MRKLSQNSLIHQPKDGRGGARVNSGPKPGIKKPVAASSSFVIFSQEEERRKWRRIVALCEKRKNVESWIRAMIYINEMQRGRPYVATNPALGAGMVSDPRLTAHIKNLIPGPVTVNVLPEPKSQATIGMPSEEQENKADNSLDGLGVS